MRLVREVTLVLVCIILAAFMGFAMQQFVLFSKGPEHIARGFGLFMGFATLFCLLLVMRKQGMEN